MDEQFEGQRDGEELLFVFRRHIIAMRKGFYLLLIPFALSAIPPLIWQTKLELFLLPLAGLTLGLVLFVSFHDVVLTVTLSPTSVFAKSRSAALAKMSSSSSCQKSRISAILYQGLAARFSNSAPSSSRRLSAISSSTKSNIRVKFIINCKTQSNTL